MKNEFLLKCATLLMAMSCSGMALSQSFPRMIASGGVNFVKQLGDTRSDALFQTDCAAGIGLSSCVTPSTPKGCPTGQVWSTAGSGIAHCVGVDPLCGSGADLMHDFSGNPKCVAPATTYEKRVENCQVGYSGQLTQQRSVTTRATGVVEYGAWSTIQDLCVPPPPAPPPAPPPDSTEPPASDSLCLLADGMIAKIGRRTNRCFIESNVGGYPQGESFLCTPSGWKFFPSSSNRFNDCD